MRMIIFDQYWKNMQVKSWIIAFFVGIGLVGCSGNALDVDISSSKYNLKFTNLDSIVSVFNRESVEAGIMQLQMNHPLIATYQFDYCFQTGMPGDSTFIQRYSEFQNNDYFKRLEKRIKAMHKRFPQHHQAIEQGFQRLQIHFPKADFPDNIFFMNSYFYSSVNCIENDLCIGVERYLGANTAEIKELPADPFYDWIKKAMEEKYMDRDAVCGWVLNNIVEMPESQNHIEAMINWGKVLYFTEAAFPEIEPALLLRYSQKDYDWALNNERGFWEYLVKYNMLFQKNATDQAGLIQEGPFTAGIPMKGPDRLGQFLGYRIIKSYIEQNDVTLLQLLKTPYAQILQEYEIND